ncbi:hypothetical protein [Kitasatospora sp. NPDC093806]|uniref:hypothetical protein n=1 Tax=Kitasatospora sp. NPDC093806 TaxID=3155075 RepID=UPI00342EA794
MRLRHVLMAAALVASPLALAAPSAQAAPGDSLHGVTIDGFSSVTPGGGWSEGTVTLKNDTDQPSAAEHVLIYIGSQALGLDQVVAEYADGDSGAWQPVKLVAQKLSSDPDGYEGTAADLTGAGVEVQPHAARTFKLRFKLVQSKHEGPAVDVNLEAFAGARLGPDGQAQDWASRTGKSVKVTGLTTAIEGLPKSIPADGKPHPFKVSIKTANNFDWHLTTASFFLWQGQGVGSMNGPAACDAEVDVQDPKDGSWHRVDLGAVGMVGGTVDVAKWATGPVGNQSLNARITLGKNFKLDNSDPELGFGYYPGAGPVLFWTTQRLASTPVDGAPDCVNPGAVAPTAKPSATATPAKPTASPSPTTAAKAAAKPSPTKAAGPELADTGSSNLAVPAAIAAALLAVGATAITLARRTRRTTRG